MSITDQGAAGSFSSLTVGGNATITGDLTVGSDTRTFTKLFLNGATSTTKDIQFLTAGSRRWIIQCNAVAESGADAGSNFAILARTDAGAAIDTPLEIARAAGGLMQVRRTLSMEKPVSLVVLTTAQRDALAIADRPQGALIFNSTTGTAQVQTTAPAAPTWVSL